jgi:hypothetical protein
MVATGMAWCLVLSSCTESTHRLADESRLPKWFSISPGTARAAYAVDIDVLTGNIARIKLRNNSGDVLVVKTGTVRPHPSSVANNYIFPIRQLITVDGVTEVIEQRAPGPLLYVSDDPSLIRGISGAP